MESKECRLEKERYMRIAIELAKKGEGRVNPNPLVGAVIVKEGRIIGQGYHRKYGELHAERDAFKNCSEDPSGAEMYVTLEPCAHQGKQPPCVEAIIEKKIRRVYIGSRDPNPLVSGKGVKILRDHGIQVVEDLLIEECDSLNEVFFHYIKTKKPYVVMKYAQTLDGKIACHTGASKWVSGEAAREDVQRLRNRYTGIMCGVGTVLADDPALTCHMENGRNPVRIILDSKLRMPLDSKLVQEASDGKTWIVSLSCDEKLKKCYEEKGCRMIHGKEKDGKIDIPDLLNRLGNDGIDGILLEGGGTLNFSFLQEGKVQKIISYIAPKIFGGRDAKTSVEGLGVDIPDEAIKLRILKMEKIGDDLRIEGNTVQDSSNLRCEDQERRSACLQE